MKRRISTIRFVSVIALLVLAAWLSNCQKAPKAGWDIVPEILSTIQAPVFPDHDYAVTDYGAVGDGTTDCSDAFAQAIDACSKTGGRVVVPQGKFLTGPIHLKSNVNLHVSKDAVILFSADYEKYRPFVYSRWEGVELMNVSPFIYAFEQENIAITGKGTLDGQADEEHWWPWTGDPRHGWKQGMASQRDTKPILFEMVKNGVPVQERVFPDGTFLRPPFVQPYRCRNVLIEGVTIINSPFWELNPQLCENVTVRDVHISSHGPNNDGCDPESCKNVLIENCTFDTGDDCIAIKSGRNTDGRRVNRPVENIIIRGCEMKDGHGGVVVGSEISAGARNIFAEQCRMDSPNLQRALRIKTNSARGGFVENVFFRDVQVGQVSDAVVLVNFYYGEGDDDEFTPVVRNVHVENVASGKSQYGLRLLGYPQSPVRDIFLKNCTFNNVARGNQFINVKNIVAEDVTINGEKFDGIAEKMIPPAVLSALDKAIGDGAVIRINESELRDGTVYEFQARVENERRTIRISQAGKIL